MLDFFLFFLHILNIWNGNVALNVSLVDMILVVLTISLTIFPLLLLLLLLLFLGIYIYIYKIAVNPKWYTSIDRYLKYILYQWPNRYSLQYGIDFLGTGIKIRNWKSNVTCVDIKRFFFKCSSFYRHFPLPSLPN